MMGLIFRLLLSASLALTAMPLAVAKPAAKKFDAYSQIGFDTEMGTRHFQWLVPYFDLDHLERSARGDFSMHKPFTAEIVEDYLFREGAFESLPQEMRAKLSEGLDLEKKGTVLQPEKPTLLDASGKALNAERPKLILPEAPAIPSPARPTLIRPAENPPAAKPALILPEGPSSASRSDWAILNARWNALPLEEKAAAVRVRHLTHDKVAALVLDLPVKAKSPSALAHALQLKNDAPAWLRKLDISLDSGEQGQRPIEFSLKDPARNKTEAYEVANALFRETKTERIRAAPHRQTRIDTSFHLHIGLASNAPASYTKKMPEILEAYRRLQLVRLLAAGPQNDVTIMPAEVTNSSTSYSAAPTNRGLTRLITQDHVEIRELTALPEDTYEDFARFMDLEPSEARAKMASEIAEYAKRDPSILRRIRDLNPMVYLRDFADIADPADYARTAKAMAAKPGTPKAVNQLLTVYPDAATYRLLRALAHASTDPSAFDDITLYDAFRYGSAPLRQQILNDTLADPLHHLRALNIVLRWFPDSDDPRFALLGPGNSPEERIQILHSLNEGYGRLNRLGYGRSPNDTAATKAKLAQLLRELYGEERAYGPDFLIANDIMKNLEARSSLSATNKAAMLREALWRSDSVAALAHEELSRELGFRFFASFQALRLKGELGVFTRGMTALSKSSRQEVLREFASVARRAGPVPSAILAELRQVPVNAEDAAFLDKLVKALSTAPDPASLHAPAAANACAAGFARL